jgi:hypothetical protein
LKGLVTAITVLLIVAAVAAAFGAAALAHRVDVVGRLPDRATILEANRADDRVSSSFSFLLLSIIATAVLWMIWQFRYSKNAEQLGGKLRWGPGWAIGGWFIPVGSLFIPAMQMAGAAKASARRRAVGAESAVPPILITWAVTWAAANIIAIIGRAARPTDEDIIADPLGKLRDFQRADRISLVAMLLLIAAAVLGIFLVRTLSARQAEAASTPLDLGGAPGHPPPAIA